MTYTIKDNNGNMLFAVEGVNPVINNNVSLESIARDLDNRLEDINKMNNNLDVSISSYRLISNTRTMESFGYYATEGFGEKIKNVFKAMMEGIKKFFKRIGEAISNFFKKVKNFFMRFSPNKMKREISKAVSSSKTPEEAAKAIIKIKLRYLTNKDYKEIAKMNEQVLSVFREYTTSNTFKKYLVDTYIKHELAKHNAVDELHNASEIILNSFKVLEENNDKEISSLDSSMTNKEYLTNTFQKIDENKYNEIKNIIESINIDDFEKIKQNKEIVAIANKEMGEYYEKTKTPYNDSEIKRIEKDVNNVRSKLDPLLNSLDRYNGKNENSKKSKRVEIAKDLITKCFSFYQRLSTFYIQAETSKISSLNAYITTVDKISNTSMTSEQGLVVKPSKVKTTL